MRRSIGRAVIRIGRRRIRSHHGRVDRLSSDSCRHVRVAAAEYAPRLAMLVSMRSKSVRSMCVLVLCECRRRLLSVLDAAGRMQGIRTLGSPKDLNLVSDPRLESCNPVRCATLVGARKCTLRVRCTPSSARRHRTHTQTGPPCARRRHEPPRTQPLTLTRALAAAAAVYLRLLPAAAQTPPTLRARR